MTIHGLTAVARLVFSVAVVGTGAALAAGPGNDPPPCAEFRRLATMVAGFDEHIVAGEELARFDLDKDGVPDVISISCSSSLPGQEADPCYIDVQASREGAYSFTAWQAFAILIGQRPFIVGSPSPSNGSAHQPGLVLYELGAKQARRACEVVIRAQGSRHGA